jgi:hypothetical protein
MQYLVSVIDDKTGSATPDEMAAITAFNDDQLKAGGHWVFAGGLASPNTATVIDNRDGEAIFTDGPFLESKKYLAGIWIIEAPRPRRGTQARCRGVEALQSEGRGAAVPVNRVDVRQAITQAHREEWARVVAALTRRFGDLDIAEEAARDAGSSEQSAQLRGCVRVGGWRHGAGL